MNNTPDNNTNIPAGNNSSSPLLKVLPIAVLAAVLVYFAAQVYNYFADPMTITLVYEAQAEDVIHGGLAGADEAEPLPGQTGTVSRAAGEASGWPPARRWPRCTATTARCRPSAGPRRWSCKLQQMQFALTSYLDLDAALKLDTSITGDILDPAPDAERRGLCRGEKDLAALKAAVLKRDHGSYTSQEDIQAQIKSVESEIQQQKAALSGAKTVTAKASGTYSAVCDGYESVLTEAFRGRDAQQAERREGGGGAEQRGQADLRRHLVLCGGAAGRAGGGAEGYGRVDVRLAKGFDQSIRMSVVSVSREENGQVAVLSSTRYLAQTTLLRHQAADAVLHTYQGLRVPADALRVSADGTTGVYCVDGENASFRPIELVYQGRATRW